MSTNHQNKNKNKQITKQVRLILEAHQMLKLGAIQENMVMSKLLAKIVRNYFDKNKAAEKSQGSDPTAI